jgi:hypothetical protein
MRAWASCSKLATRPSVLPLAQKRQRRRRQAGRVAVRRNDAQPFPCTDAIGTIKLKHCNGLRPEGTLCCCAVCFLAACPRVAGECLGVVPLRYPAEGERRTSFSRIAYIAASSRFFPHSSSSSLIFCWIYTPRPSMTGPEIGTGLSVGRSQAGCTNQSNSQAGHSTVTWRKTSSSCLRASSFFARTAAYSASPKFQICSDRRFQALLPASGRERGKSPCHSRARKGKGKCGRPGTSEKILRIPRKRARIPDITASSTPTSSHKLAQRFSVLVLPQNNCFCGKPAGRC